MLLSLTLFFHLSARADLAQHLHAESCETLEVRALMEDRGSCRILVAPKKIVGQGSCSGLLMDSLNCEVSYFSDGSDASMNLICMNSNKIIVLNQYIPATAVGYTFAALIKTSEGRELLRANSSEQKLFNSELVELWLTTSDTNESLTDRIKIKLQNREILLTQVTCQN